MSVMVKVPVRIPTAVGVKVTVILQFLPAARVLPHGLVLEARAKSPLVAMLLIVSTEEPVLVRVTALAVPVEPRETVPQVSEVGDTVTVGPVPAGFTVNESAVVPVVAPEVPVMVKDTVPVVAVPLAVRVSVLVVLVGLGVKAAVTPLGNPVTLRVTLPVNPFCGVTVMVLVALPPWRTATEFGLALKLKPPVPGTTSTVTAFD